MAFINVEIKARTFAADAIRSYLVEHQAELRGIDQQTDTYFNVKAGRLKLREGKIENNLIYYSRSETKGPKQSDVDLLQIPDATSVKRMLGKALGIKTIVNKRREIYYIHNVKFHLDTLEGLGTFVEIEASNQFDDLSEKTLHQQCREYMHAFGLTDDDVINESYSDLVGERMEK